MATSVRVSVSPLLGGVLALSIPAWALLDWDSYNAAVSKVVAVVVLVLLAVGHWLGMLIAEAARAASSPEHHQRRW